MSLPAFEEQIFLNENHFCHVAFILDIKVNGIFEKFIENLKLDQLGTESNPSNNRLLKSTFFTKFELLPKEIKVGTKVVINGLDYELVEEPDLDGIGGCILDLLPFRSQKPTKGDWL